MGLWVDEAPDPDMSTWKKYLVEPRPSRDQVGKSVRVLDLFSGVGGLALGFSLAAKEQGSSVDSVGAVDIDEGALRVYGQNLETTDPLAAPVPSLVDFQVRGWGDTARFLYEPELTRHAPSSFSSIDVVLAGPPCQGHSSLNNKTRRHDDRNRLYLTVPALAVAVHADVVVIENVPGVLHARENVVDTATTLLENAGYSLTSGVLVADALGWPQTRRRFFLVGRRSGEPTPLRNLATRHRRDPKPVSWAIGDLLDRTGDLMDEVAELSLENAERVEWLFANDQYDMPLHMRPDCHKEGTSYGAVYGRMKWDAPAPTLTTGFLTPGRGRFIHPKRPRTLTPREAARLQGFPDWFDFVGSEPPLRRDLAKWIGNAVPPVLGHLVGLAALPDEPAIQRGS
jgi:DNA (cytosine-5)-methyltransferase 1